MRPDDVHTLVDEFVADLDPQVVVPVPRNATFAEVGLDSLALMDLVLRLERECASSVPDDVLPDLATVGELIDQVATRAARPPDPARS